LSLAAELTTASARKVIFDTDYLRTKTLADVVVACGHDGYAARLISGELTLDSLLAKWMDNGALRAIHCEEDISQLCASVCTKDECSAMADVLKKPQEKRKSGGGGGGGGNRRSDASGGEGAGTKRRRQSAGGAGGAAAAGGGGGGGRSEDIFGLLRAAGCGSAIQTIKSDAGARARVIEYAKVLYKAASGEAAATVAANSSGGQRFQKTLFAQPYADVVVAALRIWVPEEM